MYARHVLVSSYIKPAAAASKQLHQAPACCSVSSACKGAYAHIADGRVKCYFCFLCRNKLDVLESGCRQQVCDVQVVIAKHGLTTLLSTNYYFTDLLTGGGLLDKEPEQKLVWLCGGILSNIALHPNNRSVVKP